MKFHIEIIDTVKELKEMIIQVFNKLKEAFNETFEGVNEAFAEMRAISEDIKIPTKQKYIPVKCIGFVRSAVLPRKRNYNARSCC